MQILFYLIWLMLLTVLQSTVARGIDIWGIAPNLFLSFVVLAGFSRGRMEGAICGAVFGLVYD
ncbi:MAG: rod shape-determining protein MreD, partial [Clostridia bacterium]|nr:rod shape-determining protein MreD [Clostridia bacterium]